MLPMFSLLDVQQMECRPRLTSKGLAKGTQESFNKYPAASYGLINLFGLLVLYVVFVVLFLAKLNVFTFSKA